MQAFDISDHGSLHFDLHGYENAEDPNSVLPLVSNEEAAPKLTHGYKEYLYA